MLHNMETTMLGARWQEKSRRCLCFFPSLPSNTLNASIIMLNFSRELRQFLDQAKMSQNDFAKRCGIPKSKMSRILSDTIAVDRNTLDMLLDGMPTEAHAERTRLVSAYVKDLVSPGAMLHLKGKGSNNPYANLDSSGLTPKGQTALKLLLRSKHVDDLDKIIISLAHAFGML